MITVFFARYAYLNPSWPRFLDHLTTCPSPGVRAANVSALTPDIVSQLAESSTTIVIDQSIENAAAWAVSTAFSIYRIRGRQPASHFKEVAHRLWSAGTRRVFLSNFDLHDARLPQMLERLRGRVDAFVWMFEKRPTTFEQIPPQYRDPWLLSSPRSMDAWEIVRSVAPVRIELPFALDESEFTSRGPNAVWDTCVPGAPYATRSLARSSIRAEGLSAAPTDGLGKASRGLSRIIGRLLPTEPASLAAIELQQRVQYCLLRSSRTCFVCGSGLAYPVRKFFEIPGLRIPMLAYPCVGFEDYGFVDGDNVIVTAPEDAGRNAKRVRDNAPLGQRIAKAAQDMVRRAHSIPVRATQLTESLRRFELGQLRGAQFRRGRFELE